MDNTYIERFKETIKKEKNILANTLSKDTEVDVYKQAIYLGYLDAARTFRNQQRVKKDDSEIKALAQNMKEYIDGDSEDFDSFFYESCEDLCKKYEKMTFGQAQKIVNMAFKYLYCISNKELKIRFKKCHLPLDGIMLEWIYRHITDDNGKRLTKTEAWSKMRKGKEDEPGTYRYYKKYIDKYCDKYCVDKTPLLLDFEEWVKMSQILAAENYKKTFTEDELNKNKHISFLKELDKHSL